MHADIQACLGVATRISLFIFVTGVATESPNPGIGKPGTERVLLTPAPLIGNGLDVTSASGDVNGIDRRSYSRTFKALLEEIPPELRDAFLEGEFSNVTENDIRGMNVSVLEYIPMELLEKMAKSATGMPLLTIVVKQFLSFNLPIAMGRFMSIAGDVLDADSLDTLLSNVKQQGKVGHGQRNEAASVLLHIAMKKLGDSNRITTSNLKSLWDDNLLHLVPKHQLMKFKDSVAAKFLLDIYYANASVNKHYEMDDKAFIYQLATVAFGNVESWTTYTISKLNSTLHQILAQLPAAALKKLSPDVVSQNIFTLRNIKFRKPLQGKSIAETFLANAGFKKDKDGLLPHKEEHELAPVISALGSLAAFVNPSVTNLTSVFGIIINSSDQLNLPAPFEAVTNFIKNKTDGKSLESLEAEDIMDIGIAALKNGPPELINAAMETDALSEDDLRDIGNVRSDSGGILSSFLQGLISQVGPYAVSQFTEDDAVGFSNLSEVFISAVGLEWLQRVNENDSLIALAKQLNKTPDAFDVNQKTRLLEKFKGSGLLHGVKLPPEIRVLLPRTDLYNLPWKVYVAWLDGLPSDSELRLAHGIGKEINGAALEEDPGLVGTLTPKQVNRINISEIPRVLAAVRRSKDGPQPQALKALSVRFKEYVQVKTDDYDTPDEALLKYITAAEIPRIPATVLAYFIHPGKTSKLPPDVRREILVAFGKLSMKDRAFIPTKTREEVILQGLKAIDETLGNEKKLGVAEVAVIGGGVVDLPPERIEQLSPEAFELALEIVQGTADHDGNGLKLRPCLNPQQRKAWRSKVEKIYGPLQTWDPAMVTSLCCTLALFEDDDLRKISPNKIVTCRCPSDEEAPSHLKDLKHSLYTNCRYELGIDHTAHVLALEKVKAGADFDLEVLKSPIITRRKREAHDEPLSCYAIRTVGSTRPFDKERLKLIRDRDIKSCLYELGKYPLSTDVARSLWEKLVNHKGGIENITSSEIFFSGHVSSGIGEEDICKLFAKNDLEILVSIIKLYPRFSEYLLPPRNQSAQDWRAMMLVISKNVLCGLAADQFHQIRSDAFLEALPALKISMDKNCELTGMTALAAIAERPDALGDPRNWTSADVRGIGILINGVQDIWRVPPEAFLGVTSVIAESLAEHILNSLSPEQAGYLPRFSAQSLSVEQVSFLSTDARQALDLHGPFFTATPICAPDQFICQSGGCVPRTALCNKTMECTDASDEMNCTWSHTTKGSTRRSVEAPPLIVKQLPVGEVLLEGSVRNCATEANIVIDCEAEGNPRPSYSWKKDGKQLNLEAYYPRIYKKQGQGTLIIGAPTDDDAGIYECYASNKWGIARSNPVFVRKTELSSFSGNTTISITAEEGQPLKIPCGSPHASSKRRANWVYQTTRGEMKGINSSLNTVDPEGQLWFFKVRKEDRSQDFFYVCISFSLLLNEYKVGNRVLLIVVPKNDSAPFEDASPFPLYATSNNTVALKGQDVEMCCIFSGTPLPKITWTRKRGRPFKDRAEYENHGTTLRIRNVDFSDKGIYTCEASNGVAEAVFHDVNLIVFAAPYFTVQPMIQVAPEGGTAVFHCEAGGTPSPEIRWIHNGAPLQEASYNPRRRLLSNKTIVIEKLTRADTGNYGCNATNSFSFVYKDVYVNVFTEGAEDEIGAPTLSKTSIAILVVGVCLLIASGILILALWKKYNQAVKVIRNLTNEEVDEFYAGKNGDKNFENGVPVERLPYPIDKRIPSEDLEIEKLGKIFAEGTVLGEGQFGVVHKGRFNDKWVAVKSSKSAADVEYFKAFLQEIKLMAYIDDHDNIVRFYGAVVDKIEDRKQPTESIVAPEKAFDHKPPADSNGVCSAVLELCPLGDLHGYLRTHSKRFSETNEELSPEAVNSTEGVLTPGTLLQFCKQIAAGMEFLANKTVIHGDLAARNVLVYENGVVKVTDFGLSRKLYDCANYTKTKQVPLPWRWMAIESLRFFEFSTKSDVWSFGVTMWEIFSLSQVPYSGLQWTTDFADKLESGLKLSKPKHCDPTNKPPTAACWECRALRARRRW